MQYPMDFFIKLIQFEEDHFEVTKLFFQFLQIVMLTYTNVLCSSKTTFSETTGHHEGEMSLSKVFVMNQLGRTSSALQIPSAFLD